jgi:predicted NBD/HSP70 family sugar kinase
VAVLCINISRLLDPDVIVLGGGLALAGAPLLALVRRHVMQQAWTVLPAELNLALARAPANGGVLGAAMAACSSIPR